MMDLSFLNDVEVEAVEKKTAVARVATPKLPETADLRVFGSGRVYPSKAFAEKAGLEFQPRVVVSKEGVKDRLVPQGNGMDVFPSTKWTMVMGKMPAGKELIFCAIVPKAAPKVDLFGSTKYNEDHSPIASVFTQGSNMFSKTYLVPMLAEIYGVNWDTTEYVDLKVATENIIKSPNDLYTLPKIVASGKLKGADDYIIRENLVVCPLIIEHTEPKAVAVSKEVAPQDEVACTEAPSLFQTPTEDLAGSVGIDEGDWADGLQAPANS